MSVLRRWARRLSRRKSRWIPASPHNVHEDFKQEPVYRQRSILGFGPCRQQESGFFLAAALPIGSARSLCSATMCLNPVESAVECLKICHIAGPQVEDGVASTEVSSHTESTSVHDMWKHQSIIPARCDLDATYVEMGASPLQESANVEVKSIKSSSLASNLNEEPRVLQGTDDEQDLLNCDDGEENLQEMLNLGDVNGDSKLLLSSEDAKIMQDICALLDGKGWGVDTEEFLSKTYAPQLPQSIVGIVINKQTKLPVAKSFFEWACSHLGHDPLSYHALLWKLGLNKQFDEMWELLNRMKEAGCHVSQTTFCILIKAYGVNRNPDMAVTAFKRMSDHGIAAGTHAFTTLISVFFRLKLIGEAHLCYNLIVVDGVKCDLHLFSTLIRGFGILGWKKDAEACFNMMLNYALEADLSIYNSLIEGFCCCNAMESAISTFRALEKRGLKPSASTFNMLIKGLCKDGNLEVAMELFVDMEGRAHVQPNQATYNILLQGMVAKEEFPRAVVFFKEMVKNGFVDSRSFIHLSNGLRQMKKTPELFDLLTDLFRVHGFSNTELCNALIHHLSHVNALEEAKQVFRGMVNRQTDTNIPSYAIMIGSYCRAGKLEEAIELLAELKGRNCLPSLFCYTPIIALLSREDRAAEAFKYVQEMHALGLQVNHITYNDLLKVMCRQGMVEDALTICETMMKKKLTVNANTLFELMRCLSKRCSVESATSCFRKLYKQQILLDCKAVSQAWAVVNLYTNEE